jgi:hypothetical protein
MIATGHLPSMIEARALIKDSFDFKTFQPSDSAAWEEAYQRFLKIIA